jgi:hypothetical protein
MTAEVVRAHACTGFAISPDGSYFRLYLAQSGDADRVLELPVSGLNSLLKILPEVQQIALPQRQGNASLRVMRDTVYWSLERDLVDESLALVLVTTEGFEWCFNFSESEIFRMAESLRDECMTTLPPSNTQQ